jgi:DNA helicase-2/ATP-dependent DNA helicase PcrA
MTISQASISLLIEGLNPEQRSAATTISGPLLVLAGAGTGKTKVITARIAYMLAKGIAPEQIVAVSFTNKAAREMRERVAHIVGKKMSTSVEMSTFHSFALQLVRRFHGLVGLARNFTIANEGEARNLLREALKEQNLTEIMPLALAQEKISHLKDQLVTPENLDKKTTIFEKAILRNLFESYIRRLRLYNMVDFDDLVYLAVLALRGNEEALREVRADFPYLMVDEYQDTSFGQFELIRLLAGESSNVCVVGDDDQSIYSWRGARPESIFEFLEAFPHAKRVTLEQNYRCAPNILNSANAVIAENKKRLGKTLWSKQPNNHRVRIHAAENERDEALFVADTIEKLKEGDSHFRFENVAVLVRSSAQSLPLEQVFAEKKIPYVVYGGTRFFDRKEIRDVFSYLKLAGNSNDLNSLFRIVNLPARGVGIQTLEKIKGSFEHERKETRNHALDSILHNYSITHRGIAEFQQGWLSAQKLFSEVKSLEDISNAMRFCYENLGLKKEILSTSPNMQVANFRLESVERTLALITKLQLPSTPTVADVIDALHLDEASIDSAPEVESGKVRIMTIHGSKGLEFPVVFLVGIEENVLPHERSLEVPHGEEEERRLFYVAITRAKQRLYISHCGMRTRGKSGRSERERTPSRFLANIPEDLCQFSETDAGAEEARRMDAAKRLFEMFR